MRRDFKPFIEGFLYEKERTLVYDASMLKRSPRYFFIKGIGRENRNDCLVHTLNYALGCPWFIQREQVLRQMTKHGCSKNDLI